MTFAPSSPGFVTIGFKPEGQVYFSYGVAVIASANQTGYTADAGADIDGNGIQQYWAFAKEAADATRAVAVVGCDESVIPPSTIAPCSPDAGQSV
ncbi:MAG: hypothetical protein ACI8W3_000001, partial [Myxococcota bacterium]